MRRRDFISLFGRAFALPLTGCAAAASVPVIGVLMGLSESNVEHRSFFDAFIDELTKLGWKDGRTVRIEQRWTNADNKRASAFAAELVALQPDVILSVTTPVTSALRRETSTGRAAPRGQAFRRLRCKIGNVNCRFGRQHPTDRHFRGF
jgi:putative tryptophan/tyrosine transport system substrate-binding protein